jgi:hypothetical protein
MFGNMGKTTTVFYATTLVLAHWGCGGEQSADNARRKIRLQHAPHAAQVVVQDLQRHTVGLRIAAKKLAPGFVRVQGEQQEKDMRFAFKHLRNPKVGIEQLVISPMSFMASVGKDGVVIARDAMPDRMKGTNLAQKFSVVRKALAGKEGYELGEFESAKKGEKPSVTILMAAPAFYEGEVVGAVVIGIPLWRLSQRLSRQLQTEQAGEGQVVLWVYIYRGDELFFQGTPGTMDMLVPDGKARRLGLSRSPGGYTGAVEQFSAWYGFGVRPLRVLGKDIGMVVFRMDPTKK